MVLRKGTDNQGKAGPLANMREESSTHETNRSRVHKLITCGMRPFHSLKISFLGETYEPVSSGCLLNSQIGCKLRSRYRTAAPQHAVHCLAILCSKSADRLSFFQQSRGSSNENR